MSPTSQVLQTCVIKRPRLPCASFSIRIRGIRTKDAHVEAIHLGCKTKFPGLTRGTISVLHLNTLRSILHLGVAENSSPANCRPLSIRIQSVTHDNSVALRCMIINLPHLAGPPLFDNLRFTLAFYGGKSQVTYGTVSSAPSDH